MMILIGCLGVVLVLLFVIGESLDQEQFSEFCRLEYRQDWKKLRNCQYFETVLQYQFLLPNYFLFLKFRNNLKKKGCQRVNPFIREAVKEDLPQIMLLLSQLNTMADNNIPLEKAAAILAQINRYPFFKVYVALLGDKIVGAFELLIMDNLAHLGMPSGVIEDVVVSGEYRRKGIGKAMMGYALDVCKAKGCYKVSLSSNLKRKAAHRFYESLGFQKHGFSFGVEL
jgi:ribosomal protein S18 acetylase RimI-like enzyme